MIQPILSAIRLKNDMRSPFPLLVLCRCTAAFILFLNLTHRPLNAQVFNFEHSQETIFKRGNDTLWLAGFGGLNYTQFSEIDFDFDGDMDLLLFDRTSNNIHLLRNTVEGASRKYEMLFNSRQYFPTDLVYRVQTFDYDIDGRMDLFTYNSGGIKVYRNTGSAANGLTWELSKTLLFSQYPNGYSNLYVTLADLPALVDIEGDGDMDILTFDFSGKHVEYHQNQSQELFGHSDSLVFELKNACWGKFSEDANNSTIYLNDPNSPCDNGGVSNPEDTAEKSGMHSGSTLLALDLDGNNVKDLLLGDLSSKRIVQLINGGTQPNTNSAMISADYNFPGNSVAVNLDLFAAPFYLDVDFDGKKDLIVGANAKNVSDVMSSIWFYKNVGTNNQPVFVHHRNNFLQHLMIDVGYGSHPVFFDQNNDGKKDLIIGNFYHYQTGDPLKLSNLTVYRNLSGTGTSTFAEFDDNFLDLPGQNVGLRCLPTFGDVTGDGYEDLILALETGQLRLFVNNGNTGNATFATPAGALQNHLNQTINEGIYPSAQLFDLNKDGLTDLIVGKKDGTMAYYENVGTSQSPIFERKNQQLGNVNLGPNNTDGYITPHFFRHNDTTYLFAGSLHGKLAYFFGIDEHLNPGQSFQLYSDNFLNLDVNGYSSFFVNDIDEDGYLDLWVGTDLGGIYHLEVDPNSSSSLPENQKNPFVIYPNPNEGSMVIQGADLLEVKVVDVLGRMVPFSQFQLNEEKLRIQLTSAESGIYFVICGTSRGRSYTEKIRIIEN